MKRGNNDMRCAARPVLPGLTPNFRPTKVGTAGTLCDAVAIGFRIIVGI
jgi:hypothetical protein